MSRNLEVALTLTAADRASKPVSAALKSLAAATASTTKATEQQAAAQQRAATSGIRAARSLLQERQRGARAFEALGVRSEQSIQREIQRTEAAYNRLSRSGTLSAREQSRAYDSMRGRVAELRKEMQGVSRLQRMSSIGSGVSQVGAGVTAAAMVLAAPVKNEMTYDRRLAMMANTAFEDRDVAGRLAGRDEMAAQVKHAVNYGGGTKESAAEALDKMLASGAVSFDSTKTLLPVLQKYATATGASTTDLAGIAISLKRSFGVEDQDIEKALNMAIVAGQAGSFELADMAQYLPNHLAAAGNAGMRGLDDFATLLSLNQAAAITAGNSAEAGTNTTNLLAKIASRDTAIAAKRLNYKNGKGIDLPGSLAAAREKGVNSLDAFVGVIDKVVAGDKKYQALQDKLKNAKGADRLETLNSMSAILEGSAVGQVVNDQQALKALIGYRANRDYAKEVKDAANVQRTLSGDQLAGNINFDVIKSTNDFQAERLANAKDFGSMESMKPLSDAVGKVSQELSDLSLKFPGFATFLAGSTDALKALAAAAISVAGLQMLSGKGGGGLGGLFGRGAKIGGGFNPVSSMSRAGGGLSRLAGKALLPLTVYQGAQDFPLIKVERGDKAASQNLDEFIAAHKRGENINGAAVWAAQEKAAPGLLDAFDDVKRWLGFGDAPLSESAVMGATGQGSAVPGVTGREAEQAPINLNNKLEVLLDGRVIAEVVNQYNDIQGKRGFSGEMQ